tara:strand:- start:338 stop:547 length:210 start_codon:yes stop_codon:yes gene_type:complete
MEKRKELKMMKIILIPAILTGILISSFLSGKIIDIPKGTQQGGIISAIGVFTIILTFIFFKILKKTERN